MSNVATFDQTPALPEERVDVSPEPRGGRVTDLTKSTVPLPFMITVIGLVLGIAAGVWRIDARMDVIDARWAAREQSEAKLEEARKLYLDQLAKNLEAQIVIAGLRNSAMSLTQELSKAQAKEAK